MTTEEYRQRVESVVTSLRTEHIKLMQGIGLNALDLITKRVIKYGKNASGGSFTPDYTAKYKKFKEKAGKYHGFVDFSFSNRMWNDIQLIQSTNNSATIGALMTEQRDKMKGNVDRRGQILDLTNAEIAEVVRLYEEDLLELIHKNGL